MCYYYESKVKIIVVGKGWSQYKRKHSRNYKKHVTGTGKIVQKLSEKLLLPSNKVQFPEATSGTSQLPGTPVPEDPSPSGIFGHLHALGAYKLTQVPTHIFKKKQIDK